MWTPPERIRHVPPDDAPPTAAEARSARVFQPLTLRSGLVLADRTWIPAMVPWRATEEGQVTPAVLDWYGRFAEGEPGTLVVEATGIRDVPSGPLLRIGHDRFLPGLTELARRVRERSRGRTKVLVQIIDFLRIRKRPAPDAYFRAYLALRPAHREALAEITGEGAWLTAPDTEVRARLFEMASSDPAAIQRILSEREHEDLMFGARERVTDTHLPHVRDLPRTLPGLFAEAALRAKQAGFDGVELHFAHAYTMASFLSARNTRDDGYGGSRAERARLPLEVYEAVRAAVGASFTVGCRFLCDDIIEGGNRKEDAAEFGVAFAKAGMDYVSLSTGGKFEDAKIPKVGHAAYPYTGPSGYECMPTVYSDAAGPFGRNVGKQAFVRAAIRAAGFDTPVVVAGGIGTFRQAESILAQDQADLVGTARAALADPDLWKKIRLGMGAEVRRCKYTNYCEALDQQHKTVTCQLWDRKELDSPDIPMTPDGRRLTAPRFFPAPTDPRPSGADADLHR